MMGQIVLAQCDFDFHARIGIVTQHFDDTANRLAVTIGLANNLNHHYLAVLGVTLAALLDQDILIEQGGEGDAKHGQVVVVEIVSQPDGHRQPIGRVIEVLGDYADPGMEIEIALRKHDLPHHFSDAVLAQKIPKTVRKKDLTQNRKDLRDLPLVTIDGETARDFDD